MPEILACPLTVTLLLYHSTRVVEPSTTKFRGRTRRAERPEQPAPPLPAPQVIDDPAGAVTIPSCTLCPHHAHHGPPRVASSWPAVQGVRPDTPRLRPAHDASPMIGTTLIGRGSFCPAPPPPLPRPRPA